jgi:hypothetical protein
MSEKILNTIEEGVLRIGDLELNVAVLEDKTRIVTHSDVFKSLGRTPRGNARLIGIPAFMDAKNLQPLINKDLRALIKKIQYKDKKGVIKSGFNALILPEVADLYLTAREQRVISSKQQLDTAYKAEVLSRGLSRVGIIALVDEATGYQYIRDKKALEVVLGAYISDEVAKWQLTFTEDFYEQIFRLWKQTYNKQKQKRPAFFGHLTNRYIYEPIKDGVVLDGIKQRANDDNNKAKLHQYLTQDVGKEHLRRQIIEVAALMSVCDTKEQFIEVFKKKYQKDYQHSMFGNMPIVMANTKQDTPKELDSITKAVVSHKIDPDEPLPNNTFKKS